jgi:hypothetical protein
MSSATFLKMTSRGALAGAELGCAKLGNPKTAINAKCTTTITPDLKNIEVLHGEANISKSST